MDLIERQAAIDAMKDTFKGTMVGTRVAVDAINRLPSAEPRCIANIHFSQEQLDEAFAKVKADILSVKPKTGKWTKETKYHKDQFQEFYYYTIKCSVCGSAPEKNWHLTHYCPNCGSRMLEEGGEDDE